MPELSIDEKDNETALKISDDKDSQLYFRCPTDSCFVNNYFDIGLLSWETSFAIQPEFNYYKAVTYMPSYLSKEEHESSQAMKQFKYSLQETVYIMPELWLRKIFPGVANANSNIPEKLVRTMLSKKEVIRVT